MHHVQHIISVNLAFLLCFWISTVGFPSLSAGRGHSSLEYASLLFLPHGIRVLSAWLFGWKSVLYLAPGSYIAHFWRLGEVTLSPPVILMPLFGITCVALVFELVARMGLDLRLRPGYIAPWKDILLVGAGASIINAIGSNLIVQNSIDMMLFYLLGDIMGMILVFVVLMLIFRFARRLGS